MGGMYFLPGNVVEVSNFATTEHNLNLIKPTYARSSHEIKFGNRIYCHQ